MFRIVSLRPSLVVLLATLLLLATSIGAFAENRGAGLRQATEYSHRCIIPYNIEDYGYSTGIHIVPFSSGNEEITFCFFSGGEPYAERTWTVTPEGLTDLASGFLPAGVKLKFPTMIMIDSQINLNDSSREIEFWVTQFLFNNVGFSHQTFTSYALNSVLY